MSIARQETKRIGDYDFTVRVLPFGESRKAFHRFRRYLEIFADQDALDLGPFMIAEMSGMMPEEDFDYFFKVFAEVSTVALSEKQQLAKLSDPIVQETLFGGAIELALYWLDFAAEVNFGGVAKRLASVKPVIEAKAEAKAAGKAKAAGG